MRLLVTGASGFIGRALIARLKLGHEWSATYLSRPPATQTTDGVTAARGGATHAERAAARWYRLDLRDLGMTHAVLEAIRPTLVWHLAYDKTNPADTITTGTRHLLAAAASVGARVLLLSTDQVFDGRTGNYTEEAPPCPLHAYGRAKQAAEEEVLAAGGAVVRTSLVYRLRPPDPVNTDLLLAPLARGERPRLFTDEFRCPIHVADLAEALVELVDWPAERWHELPRRGVLHVAGPEALDRHAFAQKLAPLLDIRPDQLQAARIAESGLPRPANCTLDSGLARALLRTRIRSVNEMCASLPRIPAAPDAT